MYDVIGIFESRRAAEAAVERLVALGIRRENVSLLTPDRNGAQATKVRTTETEQPGVGAAIGGVVGAAAGASAGVLATALASVVLPRTQHERYRETHRQ